MQPTPALSSRLIPLVQLGLAVGAIRYALEFIKPEYSMFFGLYYVMPIALLAIGVRGTWGNIRWRALASTMILMALLTWGIWNTISYTTGQFLEWNHGRFFNEDGNDATRAAPIGDTVTMKLVWGVSQGLLTSLAGSVWSIAFGTLFIWLPGLQRARAENHD
jgi:hypothetical protein